MRCTCMWWVTHNVIVTWDYSDMHRDTHHTHTCTYICIRSDTVSRDYVSQVIHTTSENRWHVSQVSMKYAVYGVCYVRIVCMYTGGESVSITAQCATHWGLEMEMGLCQLTHFSNLKLTEEEEGWRACIDQVMLITDCLLVCLFVCAFWDSVVQWV